MAYWLDRTENLIGKEALNKLGNSNIAIIGIGGVGSFCTEALARLGIKNITLIDKDVVDITNINRQLIADTTTVGKLKVDVMKERILKINPNANVTTFPVFLDENNIPSLISKNYDYVIDCIDNVNSKVALIEYCYKENIEIISALGTGNKLDPTKFEVTDISKTSVCPLARIIRKKLKSKNIEHLTVVYSREEPIKIENSKSPASISFVPSTAGLIIASVVAEKLTSK